MTATNYGETITKGGQPLGSCRVIKRPKITVGKRSTTNHGSGGWAGSAPNGLKTVDDVSVEVLLEAGVLSTLIADIGGPTEEIVITGAFESLTFDGWIVSVDPKDADADSPDTDKATVVIAVTGEVTVDDNP